MVMPVVKIYALVFVSTVWTPIASAVSCEDEDAHTHTNTFLLLSTPPLLMDQLSQLSCVCNL